MGKAIEEIALDNGHQIVMKMDAPGNHDENVEQLKKADAAIEFSHPDSAVGNLLWCFRTGIPVVCGTTGWLDKMEEVKNECIQMNGAFLYSSNFSIGVNLFFELNKTLAKLMKAHPAYDVKMEETHHIHKKDAPSGTAITLAQQILENFPSKKKWVNEEISGKESLAIISKRIDEVPGTHSVTYFSDIDEIEITHKAHSREGFAAGAVTAAKWLAGKKGMYSMKDVLGF